MPLKQRELARHEGLLRDARLIIIASEDTHAVKQYFSKFRNPRIKVRVLPTEDGKSAPDHVLSRLKKYEGEYDTNDDDEFWLCIDVDHWANSGHIQNLTDVIRTCKQNRYQIALCNPCFEVWLLLHFTDVMPEDKSCNAYVAKLKEFCGTYNKTNIDVVRISKQDIDAAVARAIKIDRDSDNEIPSAPNARVYRIVKSIFKQNETTIR